ncbi:MAG: BatA domain-containing protein, partial [Planctomycetota bacterium]|nr:BatA domain-containing protein [Planctomycetota bacterium]
MFGPTIGRMVAGSLAVITLANPALLWAAAACAAPIIIHLILRTRPRRQAFPALQFLLASNRASLRHHRLRHLLLLLLRILVILLLVAALARPISRGSWLSAQGRIKTAAVFLIDDSASMSYRFEGLSRTDRAKEWARLLIQDEARFPEGSTFMVMTCSTPTRDLRWIRDRGDATKTLNPISAARHDRGLTDAVTQALEHLAKSKLPGRELYVLTDLTQHAWATAKPERWRDAEGVAVLVLDVGADENVNTRIGPLLNFSATAPPRTALRLTVSVSAGDEPVDTAVEARVDGVVVARSDPVILPAHSTSPSSILLPPLDPGLHCGELRLTESDRLLADDSFFFALEVREPRRVAVIHRDGLEHDDASEARRIAAMISPPTLPDDRRPFLVSTSGVQGSLAGDALQGADCVVLVDLARIPDSLVQRLLPIVENGGLLLVVPGDHAPASRADAASLLPAEILEITQPPKATWIEFGAIATSSD